MLHGVSDDAGKLIHKLSRAALCKRAVTSDIKLAIARRATIPTFARMGPATKLKIMKDAVLPQYKLDRFFRTSAQDIALTGIRRCFKIAASSIRCYYSFCELRNCPPFPVRERTILERSTVFNPGATFPNYVGYIRKAFFFPPEPKTWDTAAVSNIADALKLLGKGRYRFPNSNKSVLIFRILLRDARDSPLAQLDYISFLYALRAPIRSFAVEKRFS